MSAPPPAAFMLAKHKRVEKRWCNSSAKLGENSNDELLDQASPKVLNYTNALSYKLVKTVFKDIKNQVDETVRESDPSIDHVLFVI